MEIESYLQSDFRSLELHELIAKKIAADPTLVNIAISNINRWKSQNDFAQPYLEDWLNIINQGLEPLLTFLRSTSHEGQRLRSSSPFTGILTEEERTAIFEKFKK